ncbi:hypothetical protein CP967_01900 [Streptomyces nitrosporeus]|uniref:Uncharacterized protein n=1 Tax=Streptomyces nitrosporeus TaxID=28894 RepID=A0A5J6F4Y3_9ACTN|nr:hypothetical protein [Streptomyces nitrosporeus]QEU70874.1 hypothetical protein CP967_01900 [Streptomyces nitrosporeus]GGZ21154.1 hypothetical protein GCM10010327_60220 [Streptomyces nitrosporeus]
MFTARTGLRIATGVTTMTVAFVGLGAGAASAAGWPPLQEGAYLYAGPTGEGAVTEADLGDLGTCHTLAVPARSVQIAAGSVSLELYSGTDCAAATPWRTGSLARTDLPWAMLSYRVVPA